MLSHKELIVSYGHDKKICLYNFKKKELLDSRQMESHVTSMKMTKADQGANRHVIAACQNGQLYMFEIAEN
jgi:hypothetical protein